MKTLNMLETPKALDTKGNNSSRYYNGQSAGIGKILQGPRDYQGATLRVGGIVRSTMKVVANTNVFSIG